MMKTKRSGRIAEVGWADDKESLLNADGAR